MSYNKENRIRTHVQPAAYTVKPRQEHYLWKRNRSTALEIVLWAYMHFQKQFRSVGVESTSVKKTKLFPYGLYVFTTHGTKSGPIGGIRTSGRTPTFHARSELPIHLTDQRIDLTTNFRRLFQQTVQHMCLFSRCLRHRLPRAENCQHNVPY